MDNDKFLETVLHEWSSRIADGKPNIQSPAHLLELQTVLRNCNVSDEFVTEFMNNIYAQVDDTLLTVESHWFNTPTGSYNPDKELVDTSPKDSEDDNPDEEPTDDNSDNEERV